MEQMSVDGLDKHLHLMAKVIDDLYGKQDQVSRI